MKLLKNKIGISATDYKAILAEHETKDFFQYYTIYYDDEMILHHVGATFRVKLIEDKINLCLNITDDINNRVKIPADVEQTINFMPPKKIYTKDLNDVFKIPLEDLNVKELTKLAGVYTKSTVVKLFGKYNVIVSKAFLPDLSILYEMELKEKEEECSKLVFKTFGSAVQNVVDSKYQRMRKSLIN